MAIRHALCPDSTDKKANKHAQNALLRRQKQDSHQLMQRLAVALTQILLGDAPRKEKSACVAPTQSLHVYTGLSNSQTKDLRDDRLTRKRASTSLKRVRSMSTPATAALPTIFRLLHTANACFNRLLQRSAFCCSDWKVPLSTGRVPWRFACSHAIQSHSKA